ncbi:MAG TPA: molybdopterin-synthase adenylyltransferase MoeB [Hanamia sp.]|nr:molybdopterin-synthase adenylyltransferase MoeB [Hanamia sp.]
MIPSNKYQRYQRQTVLKEFGTVAQEKLFQAKVLVVGAGGLGCPALQYLAAAGVGTIGIVDFDSVELTNLQRQTLYSVEDIGKPKAQTAADKLKVFNPDIVFHIYNIQLDSKNALEIMNEYDVVTDGTDNFATRYLVNDGCVLLNKPLVYGAVLRFEGQVGVLNMEDKDTNIKTNYRDLFPVPPDPASAPSCNEAGVLGVLPGIIGTLQATEAIKIITGIGKPLCNTIVSYNALTNLFYEFMVSPAKDINSSFPKNEEEFRNFNYEWFCGAHEELYEITPAEFDTLRSQEKIDVIDVREIDELPVVDEFLFTQIPLSKFEDAMKDVSTKNKIIVFCQTGKRSLTAVKMLTEKYPECVAYSLKGGVEAWKKYFHKRPHISSTKS